MEIESAEEFAPINPLAWELLVSPRAVREKVHGWLTGGRTYSSRVNVLPDQCLTQQIAMVEHRTER